jgi:hypothetical protein
VIYADKYLKEYYDTFTYTDKVFNFLKDYGCHQYVDDYYKELQKNFTFCGDNKKDLKMICDYYYRKYTYNFKRYSKDQIIESILKVNKKQYLKLKQNNFDITTIFFHGTKFNKGKYSFEKIDYKINKNKPTYKRKFILFYKSGTEIKDWNEEKKFGVDTLQYCFMYEILKRLIKDSYLKNFNDIEIVPTYHGSYPRFLKKYLNYNVNHYNKQDFIDNICLYSNSFIPYGTTYEASDAHTINIFGSIISEQKLLLNEIDKNCFINLPFYYTKGKIIDGIKNIDGGYNNDCGELISKEGFKGHNYYSFLDKKSKNKTIDSLFKTFIETLISLDKKM